MSNQISHRAASTSKQKLIQLVDVRELEHKTNKPFTDLQIMSSPLASPMIHELSGAALLNLPHYCLHLNECMRIKRHVVDQPPNNISVIPNEIHARVSWTILNDLWDICSHRGLIRVQSVGKSCTHLTEELLEFGDNILLKAEFASHYSVSVFIGINRPHIMFGLELRNITELIPMLSLHHVLESIGLVAPHLHALHKINKQVKEADSNYTFIIDLKFLKEFNQGNYHMVRLSL